MAVEGTSSPPDSLVRESWFVNPSRSSILNFFHISISSANHFFFLLGSSPPPPSRAPPTSPDMHSSTSYSNGIPQVPEKDYSKSLSQHQLANIVRRKLTGYVGFANLPNQWHRKSVRKGFNFNVMVVGTHPFRPFL